MLSDDVLLDKAENFWGCWELLNLMDVSSTNYSSLYILLTILFDGLRYPPISLPFKNSIYLRSIVFWLSRFAAEVLICFDDPNRFAGLLEPPTPDESP